MNKPASFIGRVLVSFLVVSSIALSPFSNVFASSNVTLDTAYRAIVKVKTYVLDDEFRLSYIGSGSGIIINEKGLVLTNNHVVTVKDEYDGSDKDASYQICFTFDINKMPDCTFIAKLVSKNADLDVALLQIVLRQELKNKDMLFPYLELNSKDEIKVNDEVLAIGYPSVGGDTVTVSKGIISGRIEKDGMIWAKTDAMISFGNSGGATISKNNKVIGITTATSSEYPGEMGYVIDIISVSDWISDNIIKMPMSSGIFDKLTSFIWKMRNLEESNIFNNDYPSFTLWKREDWVYSYEDEDLILAYNAKQGANGEYLMIKTMNTPYFYNIDNIDFLNKVLAVASPSLFGNSIQEKSVELSGYEGKLKTFVVQNDTKSVELNCVFLPYRNHVLLFMYYYGKDDKGREQVDELINTFKINEDKVKSFSEVKKYGNNDPKFFISVSNDWAINVLNSKLSPINIENKKNKVLNVEFAIEKTSSNVKNLTNEKYLKFVKSNIKNKNNELKKENFKMEIISSSAKFKLNNKLNNLVKVDLVMKSEESDEILFYRSDFYFKTTDSYVVVSLYSYGNDKKQYNKVFKEFKKLMSKFSL